MAGTSELVDAGVSARETEVLTLLGEHLTHAEIGARLFISARTVESHVASLRRKLGIADRRGLIRFAAAHRYRRSEPVRVPVLQSPLSSFVGRVAERAALAGALAESRLVSAVGPGGVGKTRLALTVAAEVADRFAGGTWCVDLVPVTDPAMVVAAVVAAVGLAEPPGSLPEDVLVAGLAGDPVLLVLDNCEHVVNAVAVLVERLLSQCRQLTVLVTSRVRLVVPFEHVYLVPGLTLPDPERSAGDADDGSDHGEEEGDAVALFVERAAAAGYGQPQAQDRRRISALCRALDGVALAIELAAARVPTLGLDGLEAGLVDPLGLLIGGARLQARHRSLQDTLDWSYRLLDPVDQAVLRRLSVFATTFSANAAAAVTGFLPLDPHQVAAALARIADHNLLVAMPGSAGTRYRSLETIRQYGARQLGADEREARIRHLQWCLRAAVELERTHADDLDVWRAAFDTVVDDLRAALSWSASQADERRDAHRIALALARLLFRRGRMGEAQHRYEQAASLTDDNRTAAARLECAAAVAKCRVAGNDALRLDRAAAGAALRAGDHATAAVAFARSADLVVRFRGMFAELPPPESRQALLAAARAYSDGDTRAEIGILTAEAKTSDLRDPVCTELVDRAVDRARQADDPLLESAALDALMAVNISQGYIVEAARIARHRIELLAPLPLRPTTAFELKDALHGAVYTSIGAGDLSSARRYADRQLCLPFLHEESDLACEELLAPTALTGDWAQLLVVAAQFKQGWQQAGRPRAPGRGMGPAAVAMVHGLRDDDTARAEWLAILAAIRGVDDHQASSGTGYGEIFDAMVLIHRGQPDQALQLLATEPAAIQSWYGRLFHQWHLALRAEAAVLANHPDANDHVTRAALIATGNPVAAALVHRAHALLTGDHDALLAAAASFSTAGCHYQRARTLTLTHGHQRSTGEATLASLDATPTAT